MTQENSVDFETIPFLIDETPFAFWSANVAEDNIDFLKGLQPDYFEYLSELYENIIKNDSLSREERQFAATALRNIYAQALETFFALICSAVQAPDSPAAYVLKYRENLISVVSKISKGESVKERWGLKPMTWKSIAELIIPLDKEDPRYQINIDGYSKIWKILAADFLDEKRSLEHNSIKHGLRISMGGVRVSIGLPDGEMLSLGGIDYGSSFLIPTPIGGSKHNIFFRKISVNWTPDDMVHGIAIIVRSLKNVISFLKVRSSYPIEEVKFEIANSIEAFDFPEIASRGILSYSDNSSIIIESKNLFSKDKIEKYYNTYESPNPPV